ncbi:hypothetical protein Gpo141_00004139 [Globisporangium polare]
MASVFAQALALGALSLAVTTEQALSATTSTPAVTTQTGYFKAQTHACTDFAKTNWDDVKYACAWTHTIDGQSYSNVFIQRYDGSFDKSCFCVDGLSTYDPWGSRWTLSEDTGMTCYSRDAKLAADLRALFDAVNCPTSPLIWVDTTEGSRPSGSGASQAPALL